MADGFDDRPKTFRLSRGPSDLWLLFSAFAFAAVLMVAPAAVPWIFRAMLLAAALLLLRSIPSIRRLADASDRGWSPLGVLEVLIGVGVLGTYIYLVGRLAIGGKWIDASLISIVAAELAYLRWLRSGSGTGRRAEPTQSDREAPRRKLRRRHRLR